MKRNSRQREEEKENGGGMLDGQMLWFIMHQLRRGRRRVSGGQTSILSHLFMKLTVPSINMDKFDLGEET